ncbi:MAG: hypothetical protein ACRDA5_02835 [Clostridium sp.]
MKTKRIIIVTLITILTCFQLVLFFIMKNNTNYKSKPVVSMDVNENILIKDVDNFMVSLKKYKVINRVKDGAGWIVSIKLVGTREEIIYDLNSLDKFTIKNCNINFKNDNYEVELDLKSK